MDLAQWIAVGVVTGIVTGTAATVARLPLVVRAQAPGRRASANKSDKGRLFSQEQTLQAKRQIEALKKELAVLQLASADAQARGSACASSRKRSPAAERPEPGRFRLMPLPAATASPTRR